MAGRSTDAPRTGEIPIRVQLVTMVPLLTRLAKPWFVYQPAQLIRRATAGLRPPMRSYTPLRTSWGVPIIADPTRAIGRSIRATAVYDIAVSEAMARLIQPGDAVMDAGANVGYMTVLASVAAGPRGRIVAFEPHPDLFTVLQQNVSVARRALEIAHVDLHQSALGDYTGHAELEVSSDFDDNDGTARVSDGTLGDGRSMRIAINTIDNVLGGDGLAVLKLDVEGFEAQVLRGAAKALAAGRIRHVVFEDHGIANSTVPGLLRGAEFRLFSLGWTLRGPRVQPVERGTLAMGYEAPSFIATLDPDEVITRFASSGWLVLSRRLSARIRRR
jgi:FkbM family methyltransferase